MSFSVGGITFYEPSDLSLISSWSGFDHVMCQKNNIWYRVNESLFEKRSHTHAGLTIYPGMIIMQPASGPAYIEGPSANAIQLRAGGGVGAYPSITLYGATSSLPGVSIWYAPNGNIAARINNTGQWSFCGNWTLGAAYGAVFPNSSSKGSIQAYAYVLYASDKRTKTNVKKIDKPKDILQKVEGITYTDEEGLDRVGVSAQDLEASGLPQAVDKDTEGNYIGINPMLLIYPLLEEVKLLRAELDELKARV